ncbi:RluA family pseudouridine synthase [Fusobacterium sp. PH5-44]|uniref:RluA family pseudouridine synthase n=1 Tax=unclassified Fusobacterium TaxID=2648384 RepID=UPI003D210CAF
MFKKVVVAPEYDKYEVGKYLKEVFGYSSRSLRNTEVYLNGKRVKNYSKKVRKLNRILIKEKEKETGIEPMDIPIKVAYEDENYLIIDKEPYIIVHPTEKKVDFTLANGVVNYFLKTMGKILVPRFYNRLDMNTSGLIIVVKNAYAQNYLQKSKKVKKFYMAIAKGIVQEDEFFIEKPIGKLGDELRRVELSVENGGKEAKTRIKVIKRNLKENLTLIEAELFTGRTHQIRAHLSLIGYPLLGDDLYGGSDERAKRQMLHSYKCQIPLINIEVIKEVEVGLPTDMEEIIKEKMEIT